MSRLEIFDFCYRENGAVTPIETPSVMAARRDHLLASAAAHAAAGPQLARIVPHALPAVPAGPIAGPAFARPALPAFAPVAAVPRFGGAFPAPSPTGALVGHPNGAVVPVDEPAVLAARGQHLAHFG